MEHTHRWRVVHEEFLMGGTFPVGWECVDCKKFVSEGELTPAGLGGVVLNNAARLIAPHGGYSRTSDGKPYKEQIIDEHGKLTIIA
jgi:hypothetical protein